MPTILTHAVVGVGAAVLAGGRRLPRDGWRAFILLPMLPDSDVLAFSAGIPYEHLWGHRGILHSLAFAAVASTLAWLVLRVRLRGQWHCGWAIWSLLFLITASHGLLDAFTNGGLGIALLSPFDRTRYFFPWTPIEVSPIGLDGILSWRGVDVISSEMLWVWVPVLIAVGMVQAIRRASRSDTNNALPVAAHTEHDEPADE